MKNSVKERTSGHSSDGAIVLILPGLRMRFTLPEEEFLLKIDYYVLCNENMPKNRGLIFYFIFTVFKISSGGLAFFKKYSSINKYFLISIIMNRSKH